MATDKSASILLDFVKDSVGFVYDRTAKPERYLGQVCLIAPTQAATAASVVFQYVDFPGALELYFPHPGVRLGVKFVHLHPGFSQRDAYNHYLSIGTLPFEQPLMLPNDIAALTIDSELPPFASEKLAQFNSNIIVPLSVTGTDASGTVSPNDVGSVLDVVLATGKEGLLTFFDGRNRPYARLQCQPGRIAKVVYEHVIGEMGLFELVYRGRPGSFMFQSRGEFSFENIPEVAMETAVMLPEAKRRAAELPQILKAHGGADARFVKTVNQYDAKMIDPNLHWVVERIWLSLDGYLSLDKLGERIGSDTYTALWGLHELANLGLVQQTHAKQFSLSGQLGQPVFGGLDLNVWDKLMGFYLDPLSGRPIVQEGNFIGANPLRESQSMLHTVPIQSQCKGAILIKDNKIVGIHNGLWVLQPGQAQPPARPYQMTSFNLLSDIGGKREILGTGEVEAGAEKENPVEREPVSAMARSSMRRRMTEDLDTPPEESQAAPSKLRGMNTPNKFSLSKKQMLMGGIAIAAIALLMIIFGSSKPSKAPESAPTDEAQTAPAEGEEGAPVEEPKNPEKAAEIAEKFAHFSKFPPPGFSFEDTSKITADLPSFALVSERQNQRVMIVVWNNTGPVKDLSLLLQKVPYTKFNKPDSMKDITIDQGQSYIESDTMHWFVGRYTHTEKSEDKKDVQEMMMIGAYRHPTDSTKSIVVFARPFKQEGNFDYKTSLWLLDSMTKHAATASEKKAEEAQEAEEAAKEAAKKVEEEAKKAEEAKGAKDTNAVDGEEPKTPAKK